MPHDLDPTLMSPDDRRHELVSLLAEGLLRLRDRSALESKNLSDSLQNSLEAVPEIPLTVHDG